MTDPRLKKMAKLMTEYSTKIQPKEHVLIICYGLHGIPLLKEVYREAVKIGAHVTYEILEDQMSRIFYENAAEHQLKYSSKVRLMQAKETQVMIQIIADSNNKELASIDQGKMLMKRKATKNISDEIHKSRWVLFDYPTPASAQEAGLSLEEWEDFIFDSCLIDWTRLKEEEETLLEILKKVKEIRIVAKDTDISFNVEGQTFIKCLGSHNLPDGELFTSPIKNGVNGVVTFNTPTLYMGKEFNWIRLFFKDGKVIKEESDKNTADLTKILNTDKGSRFLGEVSFGLNRNIKTPVKSILFDEKIGGSNHMALGKCYEEAPNGNDSAIHWDLIIRHEDAQGEVYLDGVLVQKHGKWVDKRLVKFNQ